MNWRTLTPIGWLLAALAVIVAFALLASAWDNLTAWLPWSDESQLKRQTARADYAEQDAANRKAEAEGNAAVSRSLEQTHRVIVEARSVTAAAEQEARLAPDAETPLGSRGDRLRDHGQRLCELVPASCAPAGPVGTPGHRDHALSAAHSPGEPDVG